ncbi:MAG: folate-binding protein [Quisquiliibacterium sp.]
MTTQPEPSPADPATPQIDEFSMAELYGGKLATDAYGPQVLFAPLTPEQIVAGCVAPLTDLSVLSVHGEQAASFLHSQLTNDVEQLDDRQARWFGYCSAKGRLMASLLGWRESPQNISLLIAQPQAEPIRKRLSMFLLRAKAKIQDVSNSVVLFGLIGEGAAGSLKALGIDPAGPMQHSEANACRCIGLPNTVISATACPRWLIAVPRERAGQVWATLSDRLHKASSPSWRWTEVLAGVPRIIPATSEQFVPQMLNFELVDGVSFKKGCYPGQEVVARTQYRGTIKRRMFLGHLDGEIPEPGSDLHAQGQDEPCGKVVLAAPSPLGGIDLLFEAQIATVTEKTLLVDQTPLALASLPYPVPL